MHSLWYFGVDHSLNIVHGHIDLSKVLVCAPALDKHRPIVLVIHKKLLHKDVST